MDETDITKLNFPEPLLSVHAPTSASSRTVLSDKSFHESFELRIGKNGRVSLVSPEQTVLLAVCPTSYIYVSGGLIHFENLTGSRPLQLKASSVPSSVRSKVMSLICESVWKQYPGKEYCDFPAFYKCGEMVRGFSGVLSGYCLYMDSANGMYDSVSRYVELRVPSVYSRLHSESITLALYECSSREEIVSIVAVGTPDNRASVCIGLHRSHERHLPVHVLSVDQHVLIFRCKEECDLWAVVIDDITSCDEKRFFELVHSRKQIDGPRGYRSHIKQLRTALSSQQPEDDLKFLLSNALECITILASKLPGLESEDLIQDTLSKLSQRISNC